MIVAAVTYPQSSGSYFDLDYYVHKHIVMVKTLLESEGLTQLELLKGLKGDDGSLTYEMTTLLRFDSVEEFKAGFAKYGRQILDDITNFTDMKATVQLNEILNAETR